MLVYHGIMRFLAIILLVTTGCAVGAAHSEKGPYERWVALSEVFPDVTDKAFADWKQRGLNDASMCDPKDVMVSIMDDHEFDALYPHTCGATPAGNEWRIALPIGAADVTVEHEVLHWLEGCTGRSADWDVGHRDIEVYGQQGIVPITYDCENTAGR